MVFQGSGTSGCQNLQHPRTILHDCSYQGLRTCFKREIVWFEWSTVAPDRVSSAGESGERKQESGSFSRSPLMNRNFPLFQL
jgi:hypothetical protein